MTEWPASVSGFADFRALPGRLYRATFSLGSPVSARDEASWVASTVLAVMLGMAIGFSGVAVVAAGTYLVGTLALLVTVRDDL